MSANIHPGLVSITFRQLSPREIVELVSRVGLECIEWGGDVHVPHGDLATAREVREVTKQAGLFVSAYGSYYRLGQKHDFSFDDVLASAVALGSPMIRVWAGAKGSAQTDDAERQAIIDDARRIADLAAGSGVIVASEWHANTLTDTTESAVDFLQAVAHQNFRTYWQPPATMNPSECMENLTAALPWLAALHVFAWKNNENKIERLPLEQQAEQWQKYLSVAGQTSKIYAMIEFVKQDEPEAFRQDAITLKKILRTSGD